jgi:hypothetical protein
MATLPVVGLCTGSNVLQVLKRSLLMLGGIVRDYVDAFVKRHLPAMRLSGATAGSRRSRPMATINQQVQLRAKVGSVN